MHDRPLRYQLFVLGLWEEPARSADGSRSWRYTLEHPQTAARAGFKSLEELTAYLQAWAHSPPGDETPLSQSEDVDPT